MTILTLLVARALNGVIGHANRLPWHLPEDLAHFRRTTMGRTIVMGRLTWESIGRVLPGRRMVVITQGKQLLPAGVERAASLAQAIAAHASEEEVFVVGGAQVYAGALPIADRIIMTEVELMPPGDVFFALPDPADWQELGRVPSTSVNGTRFSTVTFARRRALPHGGASALSASLPKADPCGV